MGKCCHTTPLLRSEIYEERLPGPLRKRCSVLGSPKRHKSGATATLASFDQTTAGTGPIVTAWALMPYLSLGGEMLGLGLVGTIIVIVLIVWLIRRT